MKVSKLSTVYKSKLLIQGNPSQRIHIKKAFYNMNKKKISVDPN